MTGRLFLCTQTERLLLLDYIDQGSSAAVRKANVDISADGSKRIGANRIKRCKDSP